LRQRFEVQVFATDIDAEAIEKARAGVYPDSIAADVAPEWLARHFVHDQENSSYCISKDIRDLVVFAKQDVLRDPPFSRLDLISCRNLLIYLGGEAQKKVLPLFHYALNQDGHLFLGSSETVGACPDLFAAVDKRWRI
jgi:two-component system CheB/CheR fusion protein